MRNTVGRVIRVALIALAAFTALGAARDCRTATVDHNRVDISAKATGVKVGTDTTSTAGRDVWNINFGPGWYVAGAFGLGWGAVGYDRRRKARIAKVVVKAIERSDCETCKNAVRIEHDPCVNSFVAQVIHRKSGKAHRQTDREGKPMGDA